jgi:hypothetical protein
MSSAAYHNGFVAQRFSAGQAITFELSIHFREPQEINLKNRKNAEKNSKE